MVFSLFKKPEKMPVRPGVKPKTADEPATRSRLPEEPAADADPGASLDDDLESLDFTGIQLEEESDPIAAVVEQAAIAYANDCDDEAAAVLAEALKAAGRDRTPAIERLWLMAFDLYQLTRDRDAFAALELEYARVFEKQPPVWSECADAAAAAASGVPTLSFKGDLVGANAAAFRGLETGLKTAPADVRLDLSRVKAADPAGCGELVRLLDVAQKTRHRTELVGADVLTKLLEPCVRGEQKHEACFRALLACYQQQGRQDDFENLAVDLAVEFEISPPSWESGMPAKAGRSAAPKSPPPPPSGVVGEVFHLVGEIRGGKLDGLDSYLAGREQAVIDLSEAVRIDFSSAGILLNVLSPHWQRGMPITLRHPHRMVAELLGVMGLAEMATFDFARR